MRPEYNFVAMLRIRNEARWIAEVIESLTPLCARIFILDDHSTDETAAICARYEQVEVFASPFHGLNEARDKNWLFGQLMERCKPTWVLCVDGDEVLSPGSAEAIKTQAPAATVDAFSFKIVFLWNDRKTARVDRIYNHFWRPSMFRPFHPNPNNKDHLTIANELRWLTTPFGRMVNGETPNLHCSSVPQRYLAQCQRCEGASLLHYGYMHRADRVRKLDYYTGIDWLNQAEDSYRHMTQGDGVTLEELPTTKQLLADGRISLSDLRYMLDTPPNASLVHAGPLELRQIA